MICVNCGYKILSSDTMECKLCGMKFPNKCTSCGSPNPVMAKYCFNCGEKVVKEEYSSSIENYHTLTENRKRVAVIFADVSGFTSLSESMDPEEVREIINETFDYITRPVYELGGTVDKYIGDCVMILFGAKYSHGDDAKRAVICAMKMMEAIKEYSNEGLAKRGIILELSIGINYGLVVTGSVGNYFDKDYTVMGDVVNTAKRLQDSANRGSIFVSDSVFSESKEDIDYSNPSEIMVKNKTNPIKYYLPISIKKSISNKNKVLVNRDKELDILKDIYYKSSGYNSALIVGEKGVGKTSLIKKFTSVSIDKSKEVWIECSPVYSDRVYHVISSLLFNIMNINFNDIERIKKNRLASFLDYILGNLDEESIKRNSDFLKLVMGLSRDNEFQNILNSMEYSDIEDETINQLTIFFKALREKYKVTIVIDDLQWSDIESVKILGKLVEGLSSKDCIFLFTSRYDVDGLTPSNKKHIKNINLKNLPKEGIKKLSCNLLQCDDIAPLLLDEIIRFTSGNPLYIEEFVKSMKSNNTYYIEDNMAYILKDNINILPNTIEKLILSNMAQLDDDSKRFLQIASIIGKDFNLSWIRELFNDKFSEVNVLKILNQLNLISLKFVHTSSDNLEKIYSFNQDTVREVIYQSVLNKDKRYYHNSIIELIEKRHNKTLDDYYEVLCYHCEGAGLIKKAKNYYYKTALKYKENFKLNSALNYFNKYLEDIDIEKSKGDKILIDVLNGLGDIYNTFGEHDKALEYFNKSLSISSLSDDKYFIKMMIATIYKEKGQYNKSLEIINDIEEVIRKNGSLYGKLLQLKCSMLFITGDSKALKIAEESEEILLKTRDYENLSETMLKAGAIYFVKGEINNSLYYLNKAYEYAQKINNLKSMARVSGNLGVIYHSNGNISKAQEYLSKSIDISNTISNVQTYISASINLGILYMEKGLFKKAEDLFLKALDKSIKMSFIYENCVTLTNLGDLNYEMGSLDKSFIYYNESINIAKEHKLLIEEGVNYLGLSKIYLNYEKYDKALKLLDDSCNIFEEAKELSCITDCQRVTSEYYFKVGEIDKAYDYCEKSIDGAKELKNEMKKLKALGLMGDILMGLKEHEKAIDSYHQSIILSKELESDYEEAKGYYRKYKALSFIDKKHEANAAYNKALKAIKEVDECSFKTTLEGKID